MAIPASHLTEEFWGIDAGPVFKARMEAALKQCQTGEHARREAFADAAIKREKRRKAIFYPAGSLIKVSKMPGWEPYEGDKRGERGRINGFSRKSRLAFLSTVATLDRKAELPKFVTLTYPAEYPEQFTQWKEDLHFLQFTLGGNIPARLFCGSSSLSNAALLTFICCFGACHFSIKIGSLRHGMRS